MLLAVAPVRPGSTSAGLRAGLAALLAAAVPGCGETARPGPEPVGLDPSPEWPRDASMSEPAAGGNDAAAPPDALGGSEAPAPCDRPPAAECADPRTRRVYEGPGEAGSGGCIYPSRAEPCEGWCWRGACCRTCPECGWIGEDLEPWGPPPDRDWHAPLVAVDGAGVAHVVFWMADGGELRHGRRAPEGEWEFEALDTVLRETAPRLALAAGEGGDVHVAYAQPEVGAILHAFAPPEGGWQYEPAGDIDEDGGARAMALGDDGIVHLTYQPGGGEDRPPARYARRALDGAWTSEDIPPPASASNLAVGPGGEVYVLGGGDALVARAVGGDWTRVRLCAGGSGIAEEHLAVTDSGEAVVVFADTGPSRHPFPGPCHCMQERYPVTEAERNSFCDRPVDVETCGVTLPEGLAYARNLLAVDPAGQVHVMYDGVCGGERTWRYGRREAQGDWTMEDAGLAAAAIGPGPYSFALDARGGLHIVKRRPHPAWPGPLLVYATRPGVCD